MDKITENDFEREDSKSFEEKSSKARTVGQWVLLGIIAVGLSGLMGFGLWTKKKQKITQNSDVEYECILHASRETPLKIILSQFPSGPKIRLAIQSDYFKVINLRRIIPEPFEMAEGTDSVIFNFKSSDISSGEIIFGTYPRRGGSVDLKLALNGHPASVKQFVYP